LRRQPGSLCNGLEVLRVARRLSGCSPAVPALPRTRGNTGKEEVREVRFKASQPTRPGPKAKGQTKVSSRLDRTDARRRIGDLRRLAASPIRESGSADQDQQCGVPSSRVLRDDCSSSSTEPDTVGKLRCWGRTGIASSRSTRKLRPPSDNDCLGFLDRCCGSLPSRTELQAGQVLA
jgi:hypothetical protein